MRLQHILSSIRATFLGPPRIKLGDVSWGTVTRGSATEIVWTGADGPVTLRLLTGGFIEAHLIATDIVNATSYQWFPPISLKHGHFMVKIEDCIAEAYSPLFWLGELLDRRQQLSTFLDASSQVTYTEPTTPATTSPAAAPHTSAGSTTSGGETSPAITSPASTSTPDTGGFSSAPDEGLSTGAKAGIGVGAVIIVALLGLLGWYLFLLGRKSARRNAGAAAPGAQVAEFGGRGGFAPVELHGMSLEAAEAAELEGRRRAAEVQGVYVPLAELGVGGREELEGRRRWGY